MSTVDGRLCGSQEPELLRFLLSAGFSPGRVGEILAQLDREDVDSVDDLALLDLERCLTQVAAGKIRRALDSQERDLCAAESTASPMRDPSAEGVTPLAHAPSEEEPQWLADAAATLAAAGACPATPTRARPAAREDEVTPPAAPLKQAARRDPARRGVVRRVQYPDEGVMRLQAATRLQAAERRRSATLCVQGLRDAAHEIRRRATFIIKEGWRMLNRRRLQRLCAERQLLAYAACAAATGPAPYATEWMRHLQALAGLSLGGWRWQGRAVAESVQGAAARIQAAWRRWDDQHCYHQLRSGDYDDSQLRSLVAAVAIETAYASPPGCCLPPGMLRVFARDHAARVVQDAYLHGGAEARMRIARGRRNLESSRVERETIFSYFPDDDSIDLYWFGEGLTEAIVRIQAVWRGARVRAAAAAQPGPCPEVQGAPPQVGRALLRGFDAHAAGALFAARWAAATAQGSTAVTYNAAPAEGDNKQAVPQARGDEKQSDADTAPQLRDARSEAGGDSDADAACLPKPTQSSPLPQPTSGRGRGQPAAGQTPTSSADPSATRRPFLLSMSAGLVRSHISGIRDGARVFRWEHYELLEAYDVWLHGGTVEASWDGEDCLTGGMYSGCGPQCDAGWINWIFWKLYFDSTIDVRRPCGSQHRAFAACGWREGPASAGAVLSLMMQHEQASAQSALTARAARALRAAGMPFPRWGPDDEGDSEDGESAGSDEADSDDGDLDGMSHDGDDVQ